MGKEGGRGEAKLADAGKPFPRGAPADAKGQGPRAGPAPHGPPRRRPRHTAAGRGRGQIVGGPRAVA
eukprot:7776607-Pyramimonas_sp.AAC.1